MTSSRTLKFSLALLSMVVLVGCFRGQRSEQAPVHLFKDMDDQPKYDAYGESKHFANGASMQPPLEGTLPRASASLSRPQRTLAHLKRGQQRYTIFCQPCHGGVGDGQGMVAVRGIPLGLVPPTSFHSDLIRSVSDQYLYDVVSNGIRNMSGYGAKLSLQDRWAVVDYVRALQRSQYAKLGDIPEAMRADLKGAMQ